MKEIIYTYVNDSNNKEPFSIEIAGISYCDGTYKIVRKKSKVSCFEYIIEGTGVVVSQNNTYYPSRGDVYFLHMGDDHLYYSDSKNPWVKIWINVYGDLVTNIIKSYGLRETNFVPDCNIQKELEDIIQIVKSNQREIYKFELEILFHRLIQKIYLKTINQTLSNPAIQMKEYIDLNIRNKININDISKLIFRSKSQASRIFKKEFGITPYDYFINKKIELAKSLLINTNLSIKEIAHELSFSDEHYFSNFFKSKTRVSPKKFRDRVQKSMWRNVEEYINYYDDNSESYISNVNINNTHVHKFGQKDAPYNK